VLSLRQLADSLCGIYGSLAVKKMITKKVSVITSIINQTRAAVKKNDSHLISSGK